MTRIASSKADLADALSCELLMVSEVVLVERVFDRDDREVLHEGFIHLHQLVAAPVTESYRGGQAWSVTT